MKNRRITIVAFLLIAALTLGFGYAAVTNVLDIQGSATVSATAAEDEFNSDVYFSGVVVDGVLKDAVTAADDEGYTANINTNNNDKAQFTVTSLKKTGDKETITFRIQNDSLYEASVTIKTNTNTNDVNFKFTNQVGEGLTLASGGYVDVTVEVEFIKAATEAVSASFVIELNVTAGSVAQGE